MGLGIRDWCLWLGVLGRLFEGRCGTLMFDGVCRGTGANLVPEGTGLHV